MAINFTRLFTTEGFLCGALNETNVFRATDLEGRQTTLITQFGTSPVYGEFVSPLYDTIDAAQSAQDSYLSALGSLSDGAILNEVRADRPLTDASRAAALEELVRQMRVASQSLNECPGTVVVADIGVPVGDHKFVFGTREGLTGRVTDFLVPDVYLIECEADRSQGGTAFAETFSVIGKPADSLPTDATYPSGTGISASVTAVDPGSDGGIVTDGAFPNWSGTGNNTPNAPWALFGSTAAGTHVFRSTDTPRSSGYSMNLVGDGIVVPKVRQAITVDASTQYTFHLRLKKILDPGTDWAVSAILTDSSGTTLTGNGAYSNVLTSATAGSVAATWANVVTGSFCTPAVLPSGGVFLEIRFHEFGALTTAPAATASVNVSFVSQQAEAPLYSGGPTLVAYSGITEGVVGDARTATVALSAGVPSTYLIRGIDRLLVGGLATAVVRIPTSGAPTQSDALVV